MNRKTGREMKRLIIAISISTLSLVMAIIAFFIIDVTVTANNNIKENKAKMIDQSVLLLKQISSNLLEIEKSFGLMKYFNKDLASQIAAGNLSILYEMAADMAITLYPVDYVAIINDGEIKEYGARDGMDIDPATMRSTPPDGGYEALDSLGDQKGFFVSVWYHADLGNLGIGQFDANLIVDRTKEATEIEAYFNHQRDSLLLGMLIAAGISIILTILLTTFVLRYFTRKYVVMPIEKLNRTAEEIADGSFQGEIEVDPHSAYAALQGLLRSGQKVLRKMDEEMKE